LLEVEAARIREVLLSRDDVSPMLNVGSSTLAFRRDARPHIERDLFAPLAKSGVVVVHSDLKPAEGVDVAGDVLDPDISARLKAREFRCVLVANMLEHVRDRHAVAAACEDIVGRGGLILATVPGSYPYHADPLDTLYRPEPEDLASLFRRSEPLLTEELAGPTYAQDLLARGVSLWREAGHTALLLPVAWARPRSVLSRIHRWRWLWRPYRVSLALLRVR